MLEGTIVFRQEVLAYVHKAPGYLKAFSISLMLNLFLLTEYVSLIFYKSEKIRKLKVNSPVI